MYSIKEAGVTGLFYFSTNFADAGKISDLKVELWQLREG
jgi:hypothetical protein